MADFGLARANTQDNRSALGKMCGTIPYCAPEVFYGEGYTAASDIYSLGIVLWELAYKYVSPPFESNSSVDEQTKMPDGSAIKSLCGVQVQHGGPHSGSGRRRESATDDTG